MIKFNLIRYFIPLFFIYIFTINCTPAEEHPLNPIFSGVKHFNAWYDGAEFTFEAPSNSEYFIIGIFSKKIETVESPIKKIDNEDEWVAGCRTKISGCNTRGSFSNFYDYDIGASDYNATPYSLPFPAGYHVAIWGLDSYYNIVSSTGDYIIDEMSAP
ncbi:hypothetical protein ACFL20_11015 [Spirochaetota bacterium]